MMETNISAIILTFNEELHIKRCIESLLPVVDHIYILDSYSTDSTLDIISSYDNVSVLKNKFINHAAQFNYALDNFKINSEWVIRVDADEYIDEGLHAYLKESLCKLPQSISGVYLNRHITFMNKLLRHGGMSDYWILRLWRNGFGRCEQRWMDEHIVLSGGDTIKADGKLIDDNLNTLSWWAHKHVDYSTREAIDIITTELKEQRSSFEAKLFGTKSQRTRLLKNFYNSVPLFIRPFFYFFYRYLFLGGFLDGTQGFLWCFFQGFWYRMMVDAKVFEIKLSAKDGIDVKNVIKNKYGFDI